jgi:hypothetical protein
VINLLGDDAVGVVLIAAAGVAATAWAFVRRIRRGTPVPV